MYFTFNLSKKKCQCYSDKKNPYFNQLFLFYCDLFQNLKLHTEILSLNFTHDSVTYMTNLISEMLEKSGVRGRFRFIKLSVQVSSTRKTENYKKNCS